MISEQDVLNALARIAGPDGRGAPGESGAIGGVSIRNDKIYVSIVADPAHPEKAEPMRAAAEAALKSLPGVAGVLVTLTAERPQGQGAAATKPAVSPTTPPPSATTASPRRMPPSAIASDSCSTVRRFLSAS